MKPISLLPHQTLLLEKTKNYNRVGYFVKMGLGKTFLASEKHKQLEYPIALVVCQKSKIDDWVEHFETHYNHPVIRFDKQPIDQLPEECILVINYDLVWRRPKLLDLMNYTLILDESSYIANESAKRTKFILKLRTTNVILLSGTPVGGKYEQLWTQVHLLGWQISKKLYEKQYIEKERLEDASGFPLYVISGYKNVDRLKDKLRTHGAVFMDYDDAGIVLPEKVETIVSVKMTKEYRQFKKDRIITMDILNLCEFKDDSDFYGNDVTPRVELVGDTTLTKMLYLRQLAGMYNVGKIERLQELLESTSDRMLIFYNFRAEFELISKICKKLNRPLSNVNGDGRDLDNYNLHSDSITALQYQSGALGQNLQLANKIIYYSPPLDSILFDQSQARTRRIGQKSEYCFYYYLVTKGSIEEQIYATLEKRTDYTEYLFLESEG